MFHFNQLAELDGESYKQKGELPGCARSDLQRARNNQSTGR